MQTQLQERADIANSVALTSDNSSNATKYVTFADSPTVNQGLKTDTGLLYNPASNTLTTTATQKANMLTWQKDILLIKNMK